MKTMRRSGEGTKGRGVPAEGGTSSWMIDGWGSFGFTEEKASGCERDSLQTFEGLV